MNTTGHIQKYYSKTVYFYCMLCFVILRVCAVLSVCFCTGYFDMVPFKLTLSAFQHILLNTTVIIIYVGTVVSSKEKIHVVTFAPLNRYQ